ncbi:MAG TPA: 23S rRNA (uracil(1939)-C(5))-methyltransferase RlmD [Steroidobacteraceae bacterium]|nr:23S rRNA (uracil(1939)-C(5))-methyltransferase RlmD [Steroidobacteraceae bacterium]
MRRRAPPVIEVGRVEALNHHGEGVVRGGKTAFVSGALPGETVNFVRRRHHRQHDEAQLVAVLEPAAQRVAPRCAHFGVCGGCSLQHLDSDAQLQIKEQQLRDTLERVAHVTPHRWLAPLRGPQWQYRRRARLGARFVASRERSLVGFRERYSTHVAELRRCEVLAAPVDALIEPLGALLTGLSIRERVPQVEVAVGENAVVLVIRTLDPVNAADEQLLLEFERRHAVRICLQPGGLASVKPLREPAPQLEYTLPEHGVRLRFEPSDFIQINAELNHLLVGHVIELLELDARSQVLDLFCGLGNFTLPIARRAARVVGVEGEAALVARALGNAALNAIVNAEFFCADLAGAASASAPWAHRRYTHVLLDPPRVGARELLPLLARLGAKRVLYVSCHPGSLARDLQILVHELGFELLAAGVADMFPQTTHVESLALLAPPGASADNPGEDMP